MVLSESPLLDVPNDIYLVQAAAMERAVALEGTPLHRAKDTALRQGPTSQAGTIRQKEAIFDAARRILLYSATRAPSDGDSFAVEFLVKLRCAFQT